MLFFFIKNLRYYLAGNTKKRIFALAIKSYPAGNIQTTFIAQWAISAAGSEHLPYKQRVGGSNPSLPTPTTRMAP